MAEAVYESCRCGAEIRYAGNYATLALSNFRKAHESCRKKYAEEVKTCEPSPGVTVTHGG